MSFKAKFLKLLRELMIVFIGVFAAFLLNDYRNGKIDKNEIKNTYAIIYEDLDSYYECGKRENEEGFINLFESMVKNTERVIQNKELPYGFDLVGDYWNIELINSMLLSGKLNNIDPEIFKHVSRFHTVHSNMLNYIKKFNYFYDEHVVPNLDKGMAEFYDSGNDKLKLKYQRLLDYQEAILSFSKLTVEMAEDLKEEIKSKHI